MEASANRTDASKVVLNGGRLFNMIAVYHGDFAGGGPYNIPPSEWTSHVQFTNYTYSPNENRLQRDGRVAGSLHSSGVNELRVIFEHTYDLPGTQDPRLLWYSHKIPQYGVFRYGYLVLDTKNNIVDAMEWDFLGQDPGAALSNFEQVSAFLRHTVNVLPRARLLFAARAT